MTRPSFKDCCAAGAFLLFAAGLAALARMWG